MRALALRLHQSRPMSPMHKPIDEQVVVVTGASQGIGRATALLLAGRP